MKINQKMLLNLVLSWLVLISFGSGTVYIAQGDSIEMRKDKEMLIHATCVGGYAGWWLEMNITGAVFYQEIYKDDWNYYCLIFYNTGATCDTGSLEIGTYLAGTDKIFVKFTSEGDFNNGYDCNAEGDPVNPSTGNLFMPTSDYTLLSRGLNIDISRIYASMEKENPDTATEAKWTRPFGYGWSYKYNAYLTLDGGIPLNANWDVRLHDGDGNESYFTWRSSGCYTSDKGYHMLLVRTVGMDTTWTLSKTDGQQYFFKKVGGEGIARLDSIKDNNGNKIKLTYDATDKLKLTKITDPIGRELNITYIGFKIDKTYQPPNTSAPYLQYFYQKMGNYYDLIRVEKHTNTSPDTTIVLDRYFYNSSHLMLVHILPTGKYGENNIASWDSTKGDRVNYWYDSKRRLIYEEVVKGDGDSNPANDTVVYRAHFRYYTENNLLPLDSTEVYYHEGPPLIGARNPFTESAPDLPTTNYYKKIIKLNANGTIAWERIDHPGTGLSLTTTYGSYDSDYNSASITDADNKTTYYIYHSYSDANGSTRYLNRPKKIKYATGDSLLYYYSTYGNNARFFLVDSFRDELNRKTNYFYNSSGNLDSIQYYQRVLADSGSGSPQNVNTKFTHNTKGNLTEIRNPELQRNYFHYTPDDTGAYLTESRVDIGNDGEDNKDLVTQYRYNSNRGTLDTLIYYHDFPNNPIKINYYYDIFNRLYKITYPDNTDEECTYDKRGNLLEKKITSSGTAYFKIQYEYDARNHLKKVKEFKDLVNYPNSYDSTLYVYNLNDALVEFSNANDGATNTTILYDYIAGRLYRTRYADNNKDSLGYYTSGYLKFKKDRRGKVIEYKYDDRWRLVKKRYFVNWANYQSNTPGDSVVFWLDKIGNLDSLLDTNGKIKYDYDGLDRMCELNAYSSKMVKYLFDKVSNRTKMKVCKATDTTVVYLEQTYPNYDEGNRLLKTIVSPNTFVFSYWDTGPLKEIDYPKHLKEQYWLTSRNSIDSMRTYNPTNGDVLFRFGYGYNALTDRITMVVKITRPLTTPFTGTIKYSYDNLRRLKDSKSYISGIGSIIYTYDPVGNRLSKSTDEGVTNYTYDKRNNHMTYAGADCYVYDNNGNLIEMHPTAEIDYYYDWDYENRLTRVRRLGSGRQDSLRLTYCALGKRIKRIRGASDTTRYCYDGMYVVCEFGNTDTLTSKYVYANGLLLARYDADGNKYYYHHDALGSTMGLTDVNKSVVKSYFYDDFGNLWVSWGNVNNRYLYTGQEYDSDISGSELYNLRARYYDPKVGRFISEDPMGFNMESPQMMNAYLYVENNPLTWRDITGLITQCQPVMSCPGLWHDVGEAEFRSSQWVLLYANLSQVGGIDERIGLPIHILTCYSREWLYYNQPQTRTWYTLEFCIDINPCNTKSFFRISHSVEFRDVLRIKQGKLKSIEFELPITKVVIPEFACWKLFKGELP
ncbi:MAG: RHS repeat-associated core domain-containing protein [candidate division WOR-3 bacterium]